MNRDGGKVNDRSGFSHPRHALLACKKIGAEVAREQLVPLFYRRFFESDARVSGGVVNEDMDSLITFADLVDPTTNLPFATQIQFGKKCAFSQLLRQRLACTRVHVTEKHTRALHVKRTYGRCANTVGAASYQNVPVFEFRKIGHAERAA